MMQTKQSGTRDSQKINKYKQESTKLFFLIRIELNMMVANERGKFVTGPVCGQNTKVKHCY